MNIKIDKKVLLIGGIVGLLVVMLLGNLIISWISNLLLIVRIIIFTYDAFRVGGWIYRWKKGKK